MRPPPSDPGLLSCASPIIEFSSVFSFSPCQLLVAIRHQSTPDMLRSLTSFHWGNLLPELQHHTWDHLGRYRCCELNLCASVPAFSNSVSETAIVQAAHNSKLGGICVLYPHTSAQSNNKSSLIEFHNILNPATSHISYTTTLVRRISLLEA